MNENIHWPQLEITPSERLLRLREAVLDRTWHSNEYPTSGRDPEDEDAVDSLIRAAFDEGVRRATPYN